MVKVIGDLRGCTYYICLLQTLFISGCLYLLPRLYSYSESLLSLTSFFEDLFRFFQYICSFDRHDFAAAAIPITLTIATPTATATANVTVTNIAIAITTAHAKLCQISFLKSYLLIK